MQKSELREQGYAEQEKYPKSSVITAIWVFSALGMIAFIFVFVFLIDIWKMSESDFSVFMSDMSIWCNDVFRQWKFAVYLLFWALILPVLFFLTKLDLRAQKIPDPSKSPKRLKKYMLRSLLALLVFAALFYFLTLFTEMPDPYNPGMSGEAAPGLFELILLLLSLIAPFAIIAPIAILIYLILWEFLYLAAKLVMTVFVCHDKKSGIKLKILKGTAMPVCSCAEALSLWHILVAYLAPFVFMYSLLIGLCASTDSVDKLVYYTIVAVFMSFFMSYDLTLVIYSIYLKLRHNMDYISIDHHIYDVTLFKKTFVKTGAAKRRAIAGKRTRQKF